MNQRAFGNQGEDAACSYLRRRGWRIIDRNVRLGPGEIDIIARKRGLTIFVEVKRRSSERFGEPADAVNAQKQRRIALTASLYMQKHNMQDARIRFDVIEILGDDINHIEAAFDATDMFCY